MGDDSFMKDFDVPCIPVLTKSDKLSNNNISKAINFVKEKIPSSNPKAVSSKILLALISFQKKSKIFSIMLEYQKQDCDLTFGKKVWNAITDLFLIRRSFKDDNKSEPSKRS
ncbi:MAG: hypothetical protein Ct9H90mP22_8780 [Gammaproteobacteria bacterium]|nr:MAG: hypothetical protein Ct9H90mP22_8780 [Gammaproteobacteria bacterium]